VPIGRRTWERWHVWDARRIERILDTEERQPADRSARHGLAGRLVALGDRILDVGCGPGALWPHLMRHRPRVSWVGVDASENMLAVARRRFPDVPLHHADAGSLPFEADSFDVVVLRHVLEYLPDWLLAATLSEAMRVSRGYVVLDFHLPPRAVGGRQSRAVGEGFVETYWRVADVEGPIAAAGWQVQERGPLAGGSGETDEVWIVRPQVVT